jgi:hypothetical protein
MYGWTAPDGSQHLVTTAVHENPERQARYARTNMTRCMNGACAHPRTVIPGVNMVDEPGAPVIRAGQEVQYGGGHWWVMDIDGELAHIYDEKGQEDIVPVTQLRAAHFWIESAVHNMPVSLLREMQEFDKTPGTQYGADPDRYDNLKRQIMERGVESPLELIHDPRSGLVYVGNGNTRLTIAQELGLDTLPAIVMQRELGPWGKSLPASDERLRPYLGSRTAADDLADRVREFNEGDHPDTDPDYAFVYYQGKLEMEPWRHNISYPTMADNLLKAHGFDVLNYDGKLENDTTSDWVTGCVWNGRELSFKIEQLADPEKVEAAEAAVREVLRGKTAGWVAYS